MQVSFTEKTKAEFPRVLIKKPNATLPLVMNSIEKGDDLSLVVEYNGVMKSVGKISNSPMNIKLLLETQEDIIFRELSDSNDVMINSVKDYLEVF